MELIYKNDYGATYRVEGSPNPDCEMQLVVDSVGLFMSRADLDYLLSIVTRPNESNYCEECQGPCNKIWCVNPRLDLCLKTDGNMLQGMEDLIKGTQFILNMNASLEQYRLKSND